MTIQSLTTLPIGGRAPDFDLPSTDGKRYSLASFREHPFLVVLFLANHCPYVSAWEDRILAIAREWSGRGVAFVAISSNPASKLPQDSFERMRERAAEKGYPFPYLYDEQQEVAREFGATRTPEVFVFDQERLLRYHGAVDSDWEESSAAVPYLRDALNQLVTTGHPVSLPETPAVGCTIKYES